MRRNDPQALWRRVDKTSGPNACWPWTGAVSTRPDGSRWYGTIAVGGVTHGTHRLAWETTYGPIPAGMCVCHRCDNPQCCNPAHLFLGDNTANMRDMANKGRTGISPGRKNGMRSKPHARPHGTANGRSKLNDSAVQHIRAQPWDADTRRMLAAQYGVDTSVIGRVQRREAWRHVPEAARLKAKSGEGERS